MKQNFVIFRKTPLSALWAAQSEFSSPRHISGHAIIKMPRLHFSCGSAVAQIGGAGAKARFCLRENYFLLYPEFYILHFTFTICAGARARTLCGAADDRGGLWRGHHKRAGANVARWGAHFLPQRRRKKFLPRFVTNATIFSNICRTICFFAHKYFAFFSKCVIMSL